MRFAVLFLSIFFIFSSVKVPISSAAEQGKLLSRYQNWNALRFQDQGGISCSASTKNTQAQNTPLQKNSSHIFITWWLQRPSSDLQDIIGVFSLRAGFDFDENATARLVVGNQDIFYLITEQNNGWVHPKDNKRILRALWNHDKKNISLTATSSDGRIKRYIYSIEGFREALIAASESCQIPFDKILSR